VSPRAAPRTESEGARRAEPLARNSYEEALRSGGCAMCRVVQEQEERALYSFLYEGMTNSEVCERFLRGGGFCAEHFRAVAGLGVNRWSVGVVEMGILSERLLARASEALSGTARRRVKLWRRLALRNGRKSGPILPGADCMFCRERREWEENAAGALERLLEDSELTAGIERNGLCLRHGQMALGLWGNPARRKWLTGLLVRTASGLREELREFLRKYDYRFGQEPFGKEADVVSRAVNFLAGTEPRKRR
jgi:hypothetical protein